MKLGIKGWIATLATGIVLAACGGGGGGDSGVGSGGTGVAPNGFSSGTVTGFGSVIIDGVRFDDSSASIDIERDPSSPTAGTSSDVKLGMKVETELNPNDTIKHLTVAPELIGRITSLSGTGFVAAGQTVVISTDPATPTVFEGASGLSDLAVGDIVEVHGARDASGAIVATRVERKDPTITLVRVVGIVSALDSTAKTFTIGTLTVDYSGAVVLPATATLTEGQRVAVWSNVAVSGAGVLKAKAVRIKNPSIADGAKVRLGGLVAELDTTNVTFKLAGVSVDAKSAAFEKGTVADLANGRAVRVEGTWSAGKVVASKVKFVRDEGDAEVSLTGAITDFVSISSFKLRGVPVDASSATFSGGTADNLANGVLVKIEGAYEAGVVKATSLSFSTTPDGGNRTFPGKVNSYNATTGNFRLSGFDMIFHVTDTTVYTNANGSAASVDDLANGKRILVRGSFSAGVLVVSEVKFVPDAGMSVRLEGLLYALDATAKTFELNGVMVSWGDSTAFEFENGNPASPSDLKNGVKVEVTGTVSSGKVLATKIEIKRSDLPTIAEVRGAITDFVSATDFKVAGQKVTTTDTTVFKDGLVGALANGRIVEVRGTLNAGLLTATVVQFED
ncbi:DUF5666 domain-containing protein [Niveibacterium sp.]|uniref:DUF5666 domain-containing protein n=1 Tax=Niveibacterium sp. TaxID=2017444 RepID=UPI0035B07281